MNNASKVTYPLGTRLKLPDGSIVIRVRSDSTKRHPAWRTEHELVVEKALGRKLRDGESVEHINGKNNDNRRANLRLCVAFATLMFVTCPFCDVSFRVVEQLPNDEDVDPPSGATEVTVDHADHADWHADDEAVADDWAVAESPSDSSLPPSTIPDECEAR